jgi:hypothetical protein
MPEMEYRPKKHCNRIDGTEFDIAMTDGSVFVCATGLVVFGIVQEDTEHLAKSVKHRPDQIKRILSYLDPKPIPIR